jgi:hypothetical protein
MSALDGARKFGREFEEAVAAWEAPAPSVFRVFSWRRAEDCRVFLSISQFSWFSAMMTADYRPEIDPDLS